MQEANQSVQGESGSNLINQGAHGSDHNAIDSNFVANLEASTSCAPHNLPISDTNFEASTSCAPSNLSISDTDFEAGTSRASPNLSIFDNSEASTIRAPLNSNQIFVTNSEPNDASQNLPYFHDDLGKNFSQFIKDKDNFMSNWESNMILQLKSFYLYEKILF